ncbi:MAG: hypothetical protein AAGM38_15365 [Pseudomonadota bacterium]
MEIAWDIDRGEWDRRIAEESAAGHAPLQQDWSYGEATRMLGGKALRAAAYAPDGRALALAQFTARPLRFAGIALADWALCSRGPLWLNQPSEAEKSAVYRALRRSAPLSRRRAMLFSPDEASAAPSLTQAGLRRISTGYSTASIDLRQELSALEAAMKGKWRNRLRAAERAGASVRAMRPKAGDCGWLLSREEAQRQTNGYQGLPTAFVEAFRMASEWADPLAPHGPRPAQSRARRKTAGAKTAARRPAALRLFQAELSAAARDPRRGADAAPEGPAAAMLFLTHGRAATYHIGWTSDPGRSIGAHNLLLWNAIQTLKRDGILSLDLGGLDTERGAGVARFKLGSGAQPMTLCGTYC